MQRTRRILVYGATGFSGRLIAREAARQQKTRGGIEVVLASRDKEALARIARECGLAWRAFSLDDPHRVAAALQGFEVLLNAAGPFDQTGERLAKSAIGAQCHYVDINGEVDVYKRLDDLDYIAASRGIALVSGAGHTAALSDLMLDSALGQLKRQGIAQEAAGVRIAVERMRFVSRGSARTMMRMVREQVTVARMRSIDGKRQLALSHIPVGKLERAFDFGPDDEAGRRPGPDRQQRTHAQRIASAANLIDTLTARHTAGRHGVPIESIDAFIAMPELARDAYQLGAIVAFGFQLPLLQQLNEAQIDALPEGPDASERRKNTHRVVLEVEDRYRQKVIDWCLATGDPYELSARIALEAARGAGLQPSQVGWQTPAAVLGPLLDDLRAGDDAPLAGCRWIRHF